MDVLQLIAKHEGLSLVKYQDQLGIWTVGYGHNLEAHPLPLDLYEPDGSLSEATAMEVLEDDLELVWTQIGSALSWVPQKLNAVRQAVLLDMGFNMGFTGLLGFKHTLQMIYEGSYDEAADGMLQSKWALQVPARAKEDSDLMRSGVWPGDET